MNKENILAAADRVLDQLAQMSDDELFVELEKHKDGPISRAVGNEIMRRNSWISPESARKAKIEFA